MAGDPLNPDPQPYIVVTKDKAGIRAVPHHALAHMPWSPALSSVFFCFPDRVEVVMEALAEFEDLANSLNAMSPAKPASHWIAIWLKMVGSDHVRVEVSKDGGVSTQVRKAEYVFSGWRTENRHCEGG